MKSNFLQNIQTLQAKQKKLNQQNDQNQDKNQGTVEDLQNLFANEENKDIEKQGQGTIQDLQDVFGNAQPSHVEDQQHAKQFTKKPMKGQNIDLKTVQFNPKQVIDLMAVPVYNSIIGGEYAE